MSILASSAVALTDILFADKSVAYFTLCCGLIGVCCTRPLMDNFAGTFILAYPAVAFTDTFRYVDHPRNMCGVLSRTAIPAKSKVFYWGLLGQCRRQAHHPRYVCGVLIGVYCIRTSWTVE
jgi:hypothetical protein